ncbi:MAG: hypothetical protein NT028_07020, partial [candidate division Zixibacteria bacterium]|nr:hypothetical protein [candidate division Zixibacteria bacterium]
HRACGDQNSRIMAAVSNGLAQSLNPFGCWFVVKMLEIRAMRATSGSFEASDRHYQDSRR